MKRPLFIVVLIACVLGFGNEASAQLVQHWGYIFDSTTFTFSSQDSLHHTSTQPANFCFYTFDFNIDTAHTDTLNTKLWQVGSTNKTFFVDSNSLRGVMTDTMNAYPVNANSWFVIKGLGQFCWGTDYIISFWHKYETRAGYDGGIVECSFDTGHSWQNIISNICTDTNVNNFYSVSDTLLSGEPAFSGASGGWIKSQIMLVLFPFGFCTISSPIDYQVRFRFKSDSIPDTLAGWIIKRIDISQSAAPEGISKTEKLNTLNIYPNPSTDAVYNFPALDKQEQYNIEIINWLGSSLIKMPYSRILNLSAYPVGLYFYRVTNGDVYYSGKLLRE